MATESKPLPSDIQAKMEKYRKELIAFEMCEPIKRNSYLAIGISINQ